MELNDLSKYYKGKLKEMQDDWREKMKEYEESLPYKIGDKVKLISSDNIITEGFVEGFYWGDVNKFNYPYPKFLKVKKDGTPSKHHVDIWNINYWKIEPLTQ